MNHLYTATRSLLSHVGLPPRPTSGFSSCGVHVINKREEQREEREKEKKKERQREEYNVAKNYNYLALLLKQYRVHIFLDKKRIQKCYGIGF